MTHHRYRQQPPRTRRDERAPLPGKTGVLGMQQVVHPPTLEKSPPNLHHGMAESGTGSGSRAPSKPLAG